MSRDTLNAQRHRGLFYRALCHERHLLREPNALHTNAWSPLWCDARKKRRASRVRKAEGQQISCGGEIE